MDNIVVFDQTRECGIEVVYFEACKYLRMYV